VADLAAKRAAAAADAASYEGQLRTAEDEDADEELVVTKNDELTFYWNVFVIFWRTVKKRFGWKFANIGIILQI